MPTTVVKTKLAKDFLAFVPQMVGFQPRESIVLVAFRGARTCGAMRVDMPTVHRPELYKRITTTLLGMFCKIQGADAIVPVVYTDRGFGDTSDIPLRDFARKLVNRAELSGFLVRDALCVAADGWGSYLDEDCPDAGRPLGDILGSALYEGLRQESPGLLDRLLTPQERAAYPDVDLETKEQVARRLHTLRRTIGDTTLISGLVACHTLIDPVALAEAVIERDDADLSVESAAMLLYTIQAPPHRDQIMLQLAFGRAVGTRTHAMNVKYLALQAEGGKTMDEIVLDEVAASDQLEVPDLMLGHALQRPDVDRINRGIAVLKTVVAMAPRSARPAPLCMLAWLSWALGMGSVAGIFVDQALRIDSHYGMAQLLATLVNSGYLPEWAFHEAKHQPQI